MAEVATLRKGNMYEEDGHLWKVIDFQHIKVARGGATIRLKVRNVRTGSTVEKTYNNGTRLTDVRLEGKEMQYLYHDGDLYFFMDTETYEQIQLHRDGLRRGLHVYAGSRSDDLPSLELQLRSFGLGVHR